MCTTCKQLKKSLIYCFPHMIMANLWNLSTWTADHRSYIRTIFIIFQPKRSLPTNKTTYLIKSEADVLSLTSLSLCDTTPFKHIHSTSRNANVIVDVKRGFLSTLHNRIRNSVPFETNLQWRDCVLRLRRDVATNRMHNSIELLGKTKNVHRLRRMFRRLYSLLTYGT